MHISLVYLTSIRVNKKKPKKCKHAQIVMFLFLPASKQSQIIE